MVTLPDRSFRKERSDASGPAVAEMLRSFPAEVVQQVLIPDETPFIRRALLHFCDTLDLDPGDSPRVGEDPRGRRGLRRVNLKPRESGMRYRAQTSKREC